MKLRRFALDCQVGSDVKCNYTNPPTVYFAVDQSEDGSAQLVDTLSTASYYNLDDDHSEQLHTSPAINQARTIIIWLPRVFSTDFFTISSFRLQLLFSACEPFLLTCGIRSYFSASSSEFSFLSLHLIILRSSDQKKNRFTFDLRTF